MQDYLIWTILGFVLVIVELMTDVFPATHPQLFPNAEGAMWVHLDEYELRSALQLKSERQNRRNTPIVVASPQGFVMRQSYEPVL